MSTIYFEPIIHQNKQRILLRFDNIPALNKVVRTVTNVKWSNTHKAWHIPRHKDVYNEAIKKLQPLALLQIPDNNKNTEKTVPNVITKTTERYLHISKKQLVNIISPLDGLWKKEQKIVLPQRQYKKYNTKSLIFSSKIFLYIACNNINIRVVRHFKQTFGFNL